MIIQVPQWMHKVEDNHFLVFLWFCHRVAEQHGYDEWFSIHVDDVVRMCNKRNKGLFDWLVQSTEWTDRIEFGQPLDDHFVFKVSDRKVQPSRRPPGRPKVERKFDIELTETRAQMVYMYLLGCLNTNFLEGFEPDNRFKYNSFGLKAFTLDRGALPYIKKKDRECEDDE